MRHASFCSASFAGISLVMLVLVLPSPAQADPVLPWCPDPGPDTEGFYPCPCPACMAPCVFGIEPQGECKGPDGSVSESSFTCCCCGGSLGYSFRFFGPLLDVDALDDGSMLTWTGVPGTESFDIVCGDLGTLRQGGGAFGQATSECLDDDSPGNSLAVAMDPQPGEGLWFLVRGAEGGSYDSHGGFQAAPRDLQIASSGNDCP